MTRRPDPELRYLMPAIAGYEPGTAGTWYHDVTGLAVTYLTRRDAVEALLPDRFSAGAGPDGEPLVTVSWASNRGVDWLAGGGYNLVGVNVAATYHGEVDTVAGGYCVILWEDATEPILTGREQTGIPKVYADITDLEPRLGGYAVRATVEPPKPARLSRASPTATAAPPDHAVVELEIEGLEPLAEAELRAMEERSRAGSWMGYKYIPRIAGGGADLEYATVFPTEQVYDRAERGAGRVRFFPSSFERNPTHWQVVNLLCRLEPLEYRSALLTHGKTRLFAGRARALR
jgi:hypothetical protein